MNEVEKELGQLVPLASSGDRKALQRILEIIYPLVTRYARARISGGKTPTAEDVAQEICMAVAQAIPNYTDRGRPFMAFVYGVASNKVADAHRAYARDVANPTEEVPDGETHIGLPEENALVMDGSNTVRQLLDLLNEKAREIVILRVFVGLTAEETAEIVGSTPGAVRVAQHRALATLKKHLGKQSDGQER
ncbi:MAG: sigma-70 family RNA polymerase sigma factor [Corynebacterium sp.]|nr:sigma-70 family RNA polymerase sigma factor [Corynebacterium sp.]